MGFASPSFSDFKENPMTYVMSDIHGEYDKFIKMLDLIGFSDNDTLFILGDIVDRGAKPIELLLDIMARPNVFATMGNHELLALDVLYQLDVEITEESISKITDADVLLEFSEWMQNGGKPTLAGYQKLGREQKEAILEYMGELPYYETVDVFDKTFILVHAGLSGFEVKKPLSHYTAQELLMDRADPEADNFPEKNVYVIWGHTPTQFYTNTAQIYRRKNNILIDCGACFEEGRLACLCLDDMKEYYV